MTDHTEAVTRAREHKSSAPIGRVFTFGGPWQEYCTECGSPWPCAVADHCDREDLAAEVEELTAERDQLRAAVERVRAWAVEQGRPFPDGVRDREGEAVQMGCLAALDGPTEDTEPSDPT